MQQAAHQTLINDIEVLIADHKNIDETLAKNFRKQAESLITGEQDHPLTADLSNCLEKLRERIHKQVEKRDADFGKVMHELGVANEALQENKLAAAEEATQKALSIAGQIPGLSDQRHADIEKLLDKIYPRMRKLSAWRHWGTTQARLDLIDQIKMIPGSRMDPNKIVKTLRAAKEQWRDWEKSGDHSEHRLWQEFSDACDTAYEPCREFFKQQKEERKKNLALKRELIEEINARFDATDWSRPAWKEIDKWLRQARGRFFKIGHTEFKQHKKLRANLDKAIERFEEHLARERERSQRMRNKLVEDIEALAELDDIRAAISQLEELKKNWVITVLDKRGVEDRLWKRYQKAQDAVYEKRNSERKEQDQQRNENLKLKRQVVESLANAATASTQELLAGQSVLAQHKDRFNEIGYVPRKAEKSLMDSWRKAQKQYSEALKTARREKARSEQNVLIEKARFLATLEQRKLLDETLDGEEVRRAYAALSALPENQETKMQARLEQVLAPEHYSPEMLQANTDNQLTRCMKAEVMLDLPTPEAYTQQRMAFQIERLSASMQKNTQAQESLTTIKQALLTAGAVAPDQHAAIWARIDTIFNH